MEKSEALGMNRTGIDMSPQNSKSMIDAAAKTQPGNGNGAARLAIERAYLKDAAAIGSVPMPGTAKGAAKSLLNKLSGKHPELLIDKLGERLAFERSGVRIYEALITKYEAASSEGNADVDIPAEQLREFRDQEAEHFALLTECIEMMGADPTAQTPDADVSGVASSGLMKVVTDPRTTMPQCLEAMLSLELTDNAAWDLLHKLAEDLGLDDMAQQFAHAHRQEENHLRHVQQWHERAVRGQARVS
jgi:rubrerythrin